MYNLVLLRHGKSEWNALNKFTGWTDVELSPEGIEEACRAGQKIARAELRFDVVWTSILRRAIRTAELALDAAHHPEIVLRPSWRLNERHYGGLQGLDKDEVRTRYGEEQFRAFRRGYDMRPPGSSDVENKANYEVLAHWGIAVHDVPRTESLADVVSRLVPFWESDIAPEVRSGKNVLIAAHGNSLRALIKHIEGISAEGIAEVEIPTGTPLAYRLGPGLEVLDKQYL